MGKFKENIKETKSLSLFFLAGIIFLLVFSFYSSAKTRDVSYKQAVTKKTELSQVKETLFQIQKERKKELEAIKKKKEEEEKRKAAEAKLVVPRGDLIIGLIADAHTGQEHGFSHLSSALWSLKTYVAPDIIVDLGDLIESRYEYDPVSRDKALADYRKANGMMSTYYPTYHVIGNHEVLSVRKKDIENLMGHNNNYVVSVKGYQLIFLDANYTEKEKSIDSKNEKSIYPGTLTDSQLDWLDDRLDESSKNIIFIHHPLWGLSNEDDAEDVIEDHKDDVVFIANGHKHPESLRVRNFEGVKSYDIPSAFFQRGYGVAVINGSSAQLSVRSF